MKGPRDILRYLIGSAGKNPENTTRAGLQNWKWGLIGGVIAGGLLGTVPYPIVGTLLGAFFGGLFGSGVGYALS